MSASMTIDQTGLSAGTPGLARDDGLDDGSEVKLTSNSHVESFEFRLLWVGQHPTPDTNSVASLTHPAGENYATFSPTPGVYGSWRIELVADEGTPFEARQVRIFAIKTDPTHARIPAANEQSSKDAHIGNIGAHLDDSDFNAPEGTGVFSGGTAISHWKAMADTIHKTNTAPAGGGGASLDFVFAPSGGVTEGNTYENLEELLEAANPLKGVKHLIFDATGTVDPELIPDVTAASFEGDWIFSSYKIGQQVTVQLGTTWVQNTGNLLGFKDVALYSPTLTNELMYTVAPVIEAENSNFQSDLSDGLHVGALSPVISLKKCNLDADYLSGNSAISIPNNNQSAFVHAQDCYLGQGAFGGANPVSLTAERCTLPMTYDRDLTTSTTTPIFPNSPGTQPAHITSDEPYISSYKQAASLNTDLSPTQRGHHFYHVEFTTGGRQITGFSGFGARVTILNKGTNGFLIVHDGAFGGVLIRSPTGSGVTLNGGGIAELIPDFVNNVYRITTVSAGGGGA